MAEGGGASTSQEVTDLRDTFLSSFQTSTSYCTSSMDIKKVSKLGTKTSVTDSPPNSKYRSDTSLCVLVIVYRFQRLARSGYLFGTYLVASYKT